jgi:hypothetical protein
MPYEPRWELVRVTTACSSAEQSQSASRRGGRVKHHSPAAERSGAMKKGTPAGPREYMRNGSQPAERRHKWDTQNEYSSSLQRVILSDMANNVQCPACWSAEYSVDLHHHPRLYFNHLALAIGRTTPLDPLPPAPDRPLAEGRNNDFI